jgi:hypothetical protein
VGSNFCDVTIVADPRTGRAWCAVRHRQPGKGGSANGVQSLNIMDGLGRADGPRRTSGVPVTRMQEVQWLEGGITTVPGILASGNRSRHQAER